MLTRFTINGIEFKITFSKELVQALKNKIRSEIESNFDQIPQDDFDVYEDGAHIIRCGETINIEIMDINF